MLRITERAKLHLACLLSEQNCRQAVAVRLAASGQILFDTACDGDMIVYHEARPVLYLDPEAARLLSDSVLDLDEAVDLRNLKITRIGTRLPPQVRDPSAGGEN